jgi:hypothetical protein
VPLANPNKVGLVVGALIGGWHWLWSVLVLVRFAQPIIDFIFWANMIQPRLLREAIRSRGCRRDHHDYSRHGMHLRLCWRDHLEPITPVGHLPRSRR